MGKPWEDYKEEIHTLYIVQNLPLKDVQEKLKRDYNFDACKRAFQNQIEAWGFRKNVRSSEMQLYVQQKKLRKSDSEIDLPDETKKIITPRKARRFEKRSESMNVKHSTPLDLNQNGSPSSMGAAQHHHSQMHSPSYPTHHRMSMAGGYPGYPQYSQHDAMGNPSNYSNGPSHDMSKYANNGMTISLCDDANTGAFSLPATDSRSPYENPAFANPIMTTAASASLYSTIPTEAPMYDLTGDYSYQNGMYGGGLPSGIVRKTSGNQWYMDNQDLHNSTFSYTPNPDTTLETEMFSLCFNGAAKDLGMLIDKGANINAISTDGETALTCLMKGMHHTINNSSGYTTMQLTKVLGYYNRSLDILLRYGANPAMPNRMQEYPLQLAMSKEHMTSPYFDDDIRKRCSYMARQLSAALQANSNLYPQH